MKIKIKVSYDKEYIKNNDDLDCEVFENDKLIGFFDSIDEAEKAVEKIINEQQEQGYSLKNTMKSPYEGVDICKFYRKDVTDDGFYSIEICYTLVLID